MRLALLLCLLASPALSEGLVVVSPIYSQLVAVAVPSDFRPGFEADKDGSYLLELAPQGQTLDAWTQLITVTGAKGLASQMAAIDMASQLASGYQKACPNSFSALRLPVPSIKGAQEVFAGYLGCGDIGGQSEAMVFVVMKGAQDLYTVQWAEHGPASAKPLQPDQAIWRPRADTLGLSRICDPVAGESAPYPSCTK